MRLSGWQAAKLVSQRRPTALCCSPLRAMYRHSVKRRRCRAGRFPWCCRGSSKQATCHSAHRRPPALLWDDSGKLAGLDKKLSRSLEEEVAAGSASPSSLSKSPVGPLQESSSRKTLVYLILTLNHIYPDYDFSLLRAHHFRKEEGVSSVEELIDAHLVEASKVGAAPAARAGGTRPASGARCPACRVAGAAAEEPLRAGLRQLSRCLGAAAPIRAAQALSCPCWLSCRCGKRRRGLGRSRCWTTCGRPLMRPSA